MSAASVLRPSKASPSRGEQQFAAVILLACATLAMANLPSDALPFGWLLAFTLPGAGLGLWRTRTPQSWQRILSALTLQAGACYLALALVGPMSRPAALACTILPPLAFVTARRQDSDNALGLFLSFCVLLVGVILDGMHVPLLVAYGVAACLALRSAAHLAALSTGQMQKRPAARLGTRFATATASASIVLGCLFAGLAIERTLRWLPSPSRQGMAADGAGGANQSQRSVGLSDSFVLDGGLGVLSELHGEQLVRVRAERGEEVPPDLYLRSGFFEVPGLDRWQLGKLELAPASSADGHVLRRPLPQMRTQWLELERYAGARNFVFVPPALCEIRGLYDLLVDRPREWLRQREGSVQNVYEVSYQSLPAPPVGARLDPRAQRHGLLTLPPGLDRQPFEALLGEWQVGEEPRQAMANIAAGLAARCRYDRSEPTGPHAHALENFLFADRDRHGYCMHFASAAALLLRLRGIPCRIGVGLYGGVAERDGDGSRIYGSQHAHAWVEVPFADRGFTVFDPTPAAERGRPTATRFDPAQLAEPTKQPGTTSTDQWLEALLELAAQPWLLVMTMLLAITWAMWPKGAPLPLAGPTPPPAKNARRLLAKVLRALATAGHPRRRGQTLETFAGELTRQQRLLPEVRAAFAAYQEVRFGGRPFDADRAGILQRAAEAAASMAPRAMILAPTTQPERTAGQT